MSNNSIAATVFICIVIAIISAIANAAEEKKKKKRRREIAGWLGELAGTTLASYAKGSRAKEEAKAKEKRSIGSIIFGILTLASLLASIAGGVYLFIDHLK